MCYDVLVCTPSFGFRLGGLGFRARLWVRFGVWGLGFRARFWVGFWVWGFGGFRVYRVQGSFVGSIWVFMLGEPFWAKDR